MDLHVEARTGHLGILTADGEKFSCALGPAGITHNKQEGDGATPAGQFPLRSVWFRSDRLARPVTSLKTIVITPDAGWCDAPDDPNYNRPVTLPYGASAENLWREDEVYDLILVPGHNDNPPCASKGSAIFVHLARPGFAATEGCIALEQDVLLRLLAKLTPESRLEIVAG